MGASANIIGVNLEVHPISEIIDIVLKGCLEEANSYCEDYKMYEDIYLTLYENPSIDTLLSYFRGRTGYQTDEKAEIVINGKSYGGWYKAEVPCVIDNHLIVHFSSFEFPEPNALYSFIEHLACCEAELWT